MPNLAELASLGAAGTMITPAQSNSIAGVTALGACAATSATSLLGLFHSAEVGSWTVFDALLERGDTVAFNGSVWSSLFASRDPSTALAAGESTWEYLGGAAMFDATLARLDAPESATLAVVHLGESDRLAHLYGTEDPRYEEGMRAIAGERPREDLALGAGHPAPEVAPATKDSSMVRLLRPVLMILTIAFLSGACAPTVDTAAAPAALTTADRDALVARAGAPLFDGMGEHHYAITSNDPGAQRYFNQGMVIDFAFNHAEATRSFRAAQTLDPDCAMCHWGEALALGPNINVTFNGKAVMEDDARRAAHAAIQRAVSLKDGVAPIEADLIDALATRYNGDPATDREPLDLAYAEAMRAVHAKHPDDDDASALFAEAVMTTMPWDYWVDPENPRPNTIEVIDALEGVLARSPGHPLALHLYIHAVEASSSPARAEAAADMLADLVPGAGHLVHMPSHIYWRVGRYNDASEANVLAAAVDEAYIAACNAQGFYPAAYYPHNIHFLWAASAMEGRSAVSIEAGEKVAANVQLEMIEQFPGVEFFHTIPLLSLTRFGRWDEIMARPAPAENLEFSTAIWHYARATALAREGDLAAARAERALLVPHLDSDTIHTIDSVDYPASQVLSIADHLVQGEIALAGGDHDGAVAHFRAAVEAQDALPYTEPPFWYYPTRQTLGQALLEAGDAAAAEQVYRDDLVTFPHNGWSLFGLVQSLEAQGKDASAEQAQFDEIWARADITLTGSRM